MNEIKKLTLVFPHGASIEECQIIAQKCQKIVGASVSEGGMDWTQGESEEMIFSEDSMSFSFGHEHEILINDEQVLEL